MSRMRTGTALFAIQLLLVLSVAGKFYYERHTRPRVWVRATQYDPELPIRGRYMDLRLVADSCALPHDKQHFDGGYPIDKEDRSPGSWDWKVTATAQDGKLILKDDEYTRPPSEVGDVYSRENEPCDRATFTPGLEFFIPDTARRAVVPKPGQELWVEVTVPASGPPRPIQLAVSDSTGFHPLHLD